MKGNQFEYSETVYSGCSDGKHVWDEREGHIGLEPDGDLTKMKLHCLRCNEIVEISSPLGLNGYLRGRESPDIEYKHNNTFSENNRQQEIPEIDDSELLKRMLG